MATLNPTLLPQDVDSRLTCRRSKADDELSSERIAGVGQLGAALDVAVAGAESIMLVARIQRHLWGPTMD